MSRFFLVRAEGNNADTTYPSDDVKETIGTFAFSPYFRYTLFHFGNVSLFGDAKFSYMIINDHSDYHGNTHDDKGSLFGLSSSRASPTV